MNEQAEIPLMGGVVECEVIDVDHTYVEKCKTLAQAMQYTWLLKRDSDMTMTQAARILRVSRSQFSKILNGQAGMLEDFEERFQKLCGNRLILQWRCWQFGARPLDDTWAARDASKRAA